MKGMPGCSALACLSRRHAPADYQCVDCGRVFCPTHAAQHSCSRVRDGGPAPGSPDGPRKEGKEPRESSSRQRRRVLRASITRPTKHNP